MSFRRVSSSYLKNRRRNSSLVSDIITLDVNKRSSIEKYPVKAKRSRTGSCAIQPNIDYYYDSSENSDSINESKPVGFLSIIDCSEIMDNSSNRRNNIVDQFFYQFCLLQKLYPDFPVKMLKALYLREEGNSKSVVRFLKRKGWNPTTLDSSLISTKSDIFSIYYYWGNLKSHYISELKQQSIGSYFTARTNVGFVLCYKDYRKKIKQISIQSPGINNAHKKTYNLINPIIRDKSLKYTIADSLLL